MADLVYSAICSLDGYLNDEHGGFEWARPDEQVHRFANDLQRGITTHLYGRKMYEVMSVWETLDDPDPVMADYALLWRGTDKVVISRTLQEVRTDRTRLLREFDPDEVRHILADATGDVSVGGAGLAGATFAAGLVDRVVLFLAPVIVGAGTPIFPAGVREDLALVGERRFGNGMVYLDYRVQGRP